MQTSVKLTPNDKVGNARFGCSMALSADGKTAVIGGSTDNNMAGAVWIFINSKDNWIQQGPKLVAVDGAGSSGFGASVALSADGYTLLVGGAGNTAWIFSLSDDDVWRQVQKLSGVGSFGSSVALSYDGDIALIGALDDNHIGAAWIYTRKGTVWNTQGTKLTAPDPGVKSFGKSVALSADGDIALIGASGVGNDEGSAWVFSSTESSSGPDRVWTLPGVKLPERNDRGSNNGFGYSVALSADGAVALVGSAGSVDQAAWVFINSDDGWQQQGPKLAVSNPVSFGQSVALSADGLTALISDWSESSGGIGWLLKFDGDDWHQQGSALTGSPNRFRLFSIGSSVALSADSKTSLICGFNQDIDGTAFLFDYGSWEITHIFVLMLENHSFDNIFGLSGIQGIISKASTNSNTFQGEDGKPKNYPVSKPALPIMPTDPAHEFADIMEQQCGLAAQQRWVNGQPYPQTITNEGFVSNYATSRTEIHKGNPVIPTADQRGEIMKCFDTPTQLPVIYALATEFALCDQWFASLPGPTFPNRAFLHGGSSSGLADSPSDTSPLKWAAHGFKHAHGNIFAALSRKGLVWQIFVDPPTSVEHFVPPPVCLLQGIHYVNTNGFATFDASVKSPNYPEGYTFIEPNYGHVFTQSFENGSSQHPMDGTYGGELLIKKTYESIRNSPHWEKSLFIITYDEHGGFFDSGNPGATPAPAPNDNPTKDKQFDYSLSTIFNFQQYGVRVPAVVVSPRIKKGTLDHTTYDHTSVLATIEHFFNVRPLTERDDKANSLARLLSKTIRTDCPTALPDPVPTPQTQRDAVESDPLVAQQPLPASGNVHGFLATLLKTDLELAPDEATRAKILAEFELIKTVGDAQAYAKKVSAKVTALGR
jgi:phospholipase C